MKGACKASSCNLEIAQGSVTGIKDMSTDSEKSLKSAVAQQPSSRQALRRNVMPGWDVRELDDAKAADSLAKSAGAPSTLPTARTASSFGITGQDDV